MDKFVVYKNKSVHKSYEPIKEIIVERDGALVELYAGFIDVAAQTLLIQELMALSDWMVQNIMTKGGLKETSRLVMIMSDQIDNDNIDGTDNSSNNIYEHRQHAFSPLLYDAKTKIESLTGEKYNIAYLNFYRNGLDHIGWHADKEEVSGNTIASLSLGATRDFNLRHIRDTKIAQEMTDPDLKRDYMNRAKIIVPLKSGDLLLMKGLTQKVYHHQVPVRIGVCDSRINITFRIRY